MGRRVAPAFCPGSAYLDLAHSLESLKTKPNDRSKRILSYSDIHNIENSFIANSPLPIDKYLLGRVLVTVVVCPVVHYDIHRRGSLYGVCTEEGSPYEVCTEEGVSAPPNFLPCQSN